MKYTKPELFTEEFSVEDVITASSATPVSPTDNNPTYDPWELDQVNPFAPLG